MRCFSLRQCVWWLIVAVWFPGCSLWTARTAAPPRPSLPAVTYVKPNHPQAVLGLTQDSVQALQERDGRWQRHVKLLEQRLQGGVVTIGCHKNVTHPLLSEQFACSI